MRQFDGLICFGGADWWYHNRGHYDIQMCRQFARSMPVLYVNSIGVRVPALREGSMFVRRVARKLRSWSRAFVEVERDFGVLSPVSVPGAMGRRVSGPILQAQVRRAARRMGITRPLLWVECPTAAPIVQTMSRAGLVYQRTDRYEEFPGVDAAAVTSFDRTLKTEADLTLFCSRTLFSAESDQCQQARFVDHGVEFERFRDAGSSHGEPEPADMRDVPRPRVGFVGGIDRHTFNARLFNEVARRLPAVSFVIVGGCSLRADWCAEPNVRLLGRRPYESVADYMAACDVLIMPWNDNAWIKACNPVKLKEYLAVGRPVVSTPFDELEHYSGMISVSCDAPSFASAIEQALRDPGDTGPRRERVKHDTWVAKAALVMRELAGLGIGAVDRSVGATPSVEAGRLHQAGATGG